VTRSRRAPPEKLPPRRWDTARAIGFGLMLGLLAGLAFAYFGVRKMSVVLVIEAMAGGAVSGAVLLGAVVEIRNRILGAI